ncbi:MAG: hypothetical protein IPL78_26950 [Chloroflexi bacterium]|nr:hypothetical protein [Chloroflexota bacterium]
MLVRQYEVLVWVYEVLVWDVRGVSTGVRGAGVEMLVQIDRACGEQWGGLGRLLMAVGEMAEVGWMVMKGLILPTLNLGGLIITGASFAPARGVHLDGCEGVWGVVKGGINLAD